MSKDLTVDKIENGLLDFEESYEVNFFPLTYRMAIHLKNYLSDNEEDCDCGCFRRNKKKVGGVSGEK